MLDKIIYFSIKNKLIVGLFTLCLIAWGVWSAFRLPIDALPDITNNQVMIYTTCPTLAAQEVEQFVTSPIEKSLANLPDLVELRSISRFGISIVTVVFEEEMDIYLGRQLIGEKLKEAEEGISSEIGKPEMAPLSTGLGEVFQYTLHPTKGNEHKYSAMDLRSMQDWIVARQLLGIRGVAEVNSFGGLLKQYEVAVNPSRLNAMGVTIAEVMEALKNNNENTGGSYIEKNSKSYYIRGLGLVKSLAEIEQIVVKSGGTPIFVRDIAKVQFGHAPRYGAITYNGDKEVVGGVVMMTKGENSFEVVSRVKEKLKSVEVALPKDVVLEPFLDRTDLVDRAIKTVQTNLIEGALIVILVLVLFLGNLRAGLIVASAIPLSMLFALGLMRLFGVSANLMSLGAIDFGLIIDGAVIIVEATLHHLGLIKRSNPFTQVEMDKEVFNSASSIRKSASFGEIIILMVYLPILTLTGIEGKMFVPMAQTVMFAIIGALILSFTYIPMMSALFLSKDVAQKQTFSDKLIQSLQKAYTPILERAIQFKNLVVAFTVALFCVSLWVFMRMGGEFIPTLKEGDFAFHCILPQGTSLNQSIETSMKASRIIKQFDEVRMVVGKTGSAEVPTDPMPPEATDMMVILKPEKEWKSGRTYEELADALMEELEVIPGVFFEKNQPIQMRFNELMTGVRQDVAVKVFGENMESLAQIAPQVASIIQTVEGATSPQIEQVEGLPQITVSYNRTQIANYGLRIEEVNHVISTAFAGEKAGVVYENERKYDLVVRLEEQSRQSIEDVSNLFIETPAGIQVPLSQVADVSYKIGPAQISREEGKRRVVIGFNVANRDVASVVQELQAKLSAELKLPEGYYLSYGGTFENLEKASARLMLAVPIALFIIFILLYLTFRSIKDATLIFTAIPMSAIGGVYALLLRDMPFSISAGIGFIALFGVAVLNGIVLISTFKSLEKEGLSVLEQIKEGTRIRLRPVLMTAMVASLGFLPMAISDGAGAEVQKPLATVVIGGLISATFLTLIVLPLLYLIFKRKQVRLSTPALVLFIGLIGAPAATAQPIELDHIIQEALNQSIELKMEDGAIQQAKVVQKTAFNFPNTGFFVENDAFSANDKGIWKIGVQQSFQLPVYYQRRQNLFQEEAKLAGLGKAQKAAQIRKEVRKAYYDLWYLGNKQILYLKLDSLYKSLATAAKIRVNSGESPGLEAISAQAQARLIASELRQVSQEIVLAQATLKQLSFVEASPNPSPLSLYTLPSSAEGQSAAFLQSAQQYIKVILAEAQMEQLNRLPSFSVQLYSQRLYFVKNAYSGFNFSVEIPLFGGMSAKRQALSIKQSIAEQQLALHERQLKFEEAQALLEVEKNRESVRYFQEVALEEANEIIKSATLSYEAGESSYANMVLYLSQAAQIQKDYLGALHSYNLSAIHYLYTLNL